jgi:hypothetical protein
LGQAANASLRYSAHLRGAMRSGSDPPTSMAAKEEEEEEETEAMRKARWHTWIGDRQHHPPPTLGDNFARIHGHHKVQECGKGVHLSLGGANDAHHLDTWNPEPRFLGVWAAALGGMLPRLQRDVGSLQEGQQRHLHEAPIVSLPTSGEGTRVDGGGGIGKEDQGSPDPGRHASSVRTLGGICKLPAIIDIPVQGARVAKEEASVWTITAVSIRVIGKGAEDGAEALERPIPGDHCVDVIARLELAAQLAGEEAGEHGIFLQVLGLARVQHHDGIIAPLEHGICLAGCMEHWHELGQPGRG